MDKFVIGLNSGTSFDGIDVALVTFKNNNLKPIFIDGIVCNYPKNVKEQIRKIMVETLRATSLRKKLDITLGKLFANAALKMIKRNKLKKENVLLIASHGQTIFHKPKVKSIQIGNGKIIAKHAHIKTINNFREKDIKAGGEGAPLMPFLDCVLFKNVEGCIATLNIGGISNVTVLDKKIKPIAFDIGPGNALIDLISRLSFKKDFDQNGKLAKKGKVDFKLVERALRDPYFKKRPPKSTGKEHFNENFIKKYFSKIKKKEDKLATVTFFSAKVIEKAFHDFIFPKYNVKEIIISGGGIRNKTLINHIRKLLPNVRLVASDKYKMPFEYKEAILFALLGYTCFKQIPNNIPSCTGARKKVILGKINNV